MTTTQTKDASTPKTLLPMYCPLCGHHVPGNERKAVNAEYAALKAVAEAATSMLNSIEGNATPYIIGKRRGQMRDALAALAEAQKEQQP